MINYKNIRNSKNFPIKEFERFWPFDHGLMGDLFCFGRYTVSLLQLLVEHDEQVRNEKQKDIINFVYYEDFFIFEEKLYFKNKNKIFNFDNISYITLVCYGIKYFLSRKNANLQGCWRQVFFYLLSPRFSSEVLSLIKKENFFLKYKKDIFEEFTFAFRSLRSKLYHYIYTNSQYRQNLLSILLYIEVEENKAKELINLSYEEKKLDKIIDYLQKNMS
jgi:hypothetical protein